MVVIFWLLFCFLVGKLAQKNGRSFWKYVALSAIISPIGGVIVLVILGKKKTLHQTDFDGKASYNMFKPTNLEENSHIDSSNSESLITFCPNCGAQVDSTTAFCHQCGTKLGN